MFAVRYLFNRSGLDVGDVAASVRDTVTKEEDSIGFRKLAVFDSVCAFAAGGVCPKVGTDETRKPQGKETRRRVE